MKQLKKMNAVYLEEYDVEVNPYLTTAQIQQIIDAVKKFDNWADREMNKNMLILFHATNIGQDGLEANDYELLETSGLIASVLKEIRNLDKIEEGLNYAESTHRALTQILVETKPMLEAFREKVNKNARKHSKEQ